VQATNRTIFKMDVGLPPFVKTVPRGAPVAATILILGTGLSGATGVNFKGTNATFTVISPSLIVATVPPGAASGRVQVTVAGGTLLTNQLFRVLP